MHICMIPDMCVCMKEDISKRHASIQDNCSVSIRLRKRGVQGPRRWGKSRSSGGRRRW